ncbi:hypothetical protein F4825DRAFT_196203 [Nemania diffusa]|nr:hypothetical protein F4825DRAFT_196203 [Nemania diffusa]
MPCKCLVVPCCTFYRAVPCRAMPCQDLLHILFFYIFKLPNLVWSFCLSLALSIRGGKIPLLKGTILSHPIKPVLCHDTPYLEIKPSALTFPLSVQQIQCRVKL